MRDYSIEEAIEIINSCDQSFMPDTKHFDVRNTTDWRFWLNLWNILTQSINGDYQARLQ